MIVLPTVEIRNGACTSAPGAEARFRLSAEDPTSVARAWATEGFSTLHVVDADAVAGIGSNAELIDAILRDGEIDVQANGGVQTDDAIHRLIDAGAARIVLGTRAVAEVDWLSSLADQNPGQLVVEITLRERRVVARGWVRSLPRDVFDVVEELDQLPLAGLLLSDVVDATSRNASELSLLEDLIEACDVPIMASGGVASMNDLRALEHRGVRAAVLGGVLSLDALDARAVAREFAD
jgi:phosphoribosylformimino-5-aminoimidazole carboxamide ribotide isomerase